MTSIKWQWRELSRLWRLMFPERSAKRLIQTVGPLWLFLHGAKREHKVRIWKTGDGWYCIDLAFPAKQLGVEAKGGWQKYYVGDVARDQALLDKGWQIIRVSEAEIEADPRAVKRRVRNFVKG